MVIFNGRRCNWPLIGFNLRLLKGQQKKMKLPRNGPRYLCAESYSSSSSSNTCDNGCVTIGLLLFSLWFDDRGTRPIT